MGNLRRFFIIFGLILGWSLLFTKTEKASADRLQMGTVVVMPFYNLSSTPGVEDKVTRIFISELVKRKGFAVYHPKIVKEYLNKKNKISGIDLKKQPVQKIAESMAKNMGAQFIICGSVTEYNGYNPYGLGISIEMYKTDTMDKIIVNNIQSDGVNFWQKLKEWGHYYTMERYIHTVCTKFIDNTF